MPIGAWSQYPTEAGFVNTSPIQVVASGTTITPLSNIVRITGNTTIATITPPNPYFCGPLYLFNTDASVGTISTGGNFALGVTLTRYKVFICFYDIATSKWYPSNAS